MTRTCDKMLSRHSQGKAVSGSLSFEATRKVGGGNSRL